MSRLTHWLVKEPKSIGSPIDALKTLVLYFPDEQSPKLGDVLFYLSEAADKYSIFDCEIAQVFTILKATATDKSSGDDGIFQIEIRPKDLGLKAKDEGTLESYRMSLSRAEVNKISGWATSNRNLKNDRVLKITANSAEVISKRVEFPIGSTMKLLISHFGELIRNDAMAISIPNHLVGFKQWEFAFDYLIQNLQEKIMRSAYYAVQAQQSWRSFSEHIGVNSQIEEHNFFVQRTDTNAGPPKLSRSIPFGIAAEVVRQWEVVNEKRKGPESVVLTQIQISVLEEQKMWKDFNFPTFPGGLFLEL